MDATLRIASGLRKSYKNAVVMTRAEVLDAVEKRADCYEVLNDTMNRVYGDIDGRCLETITEEDFNIKDKETQEVLEDFLKDTPHALMTSSSYPHRKISFRFVLTSKKCSKAENKKWASQLNLPLPEHVKVDTGVYGNNQKMRMLNSNKDDENRPLVLLSGTAEDTLISYLKDAEQLVFLTPKEAEKERKRQETEAQRRAKKEEREKKKETKEEETERKKAEKEEAKAEKEREKEEKKRPKVPKKKEHAILMTLLNALDLKRINDYENWINIGIVCFNEDLGWECWDIASMRGENYEAGVCEEKYNSFHKGDMKMATLWGWLKEDNMEVYNELKAHDYETMKAEFETTHFKLMNPAVFGESYRDEYKHERISYYKKSDLSHKYENKFLMGKLFIHDWVRDENIRTYDQVLFAPGQDLPPNIMNLFRGFPLQPVEGDFSPIRRVMEQMCDFNEQMIWYVERWVAWIIQKPMTKTGVILVFQGKQGVGKDTYWEIIGELIGEHFMNTLNPEHNVFTRFNDNLENVLLVKFEESQYLTNKNNESTLKGLATGNTFMLETKGLKSKKATNYVNVVMTTNNDTPVSIEDTDRRFVLCRASPLLANKTEFWLPLVQSITPDVKRAYFHHLLNLDLSDFSPRRDRVLTEYYSEVKTAHRPYHARGFQRIVEDAYEDNPDTPQNITFKARALVTRLNESSKFEMNEQRVGRDMADYPKDALLKEQKTQGNTYTVQPEAMRSYLKEKEWWYDV